MTHEEAQAIDRRDFERESRAALQRALEYSARKRHEERCRVLGVELTPMTVNGNLNNKGKRNNPHGGPCAKRFEAFGEEQTITVWAQRFGINEKTLRHRLARGKTIEQALQPQKIGGSKPRNLYTIGGKSHSIREWTELTGVPEARLRTRIQSGMSIEEAITKPPVSGNPKKKGAGVGQSLAVTSQTGEFPSVQESTEMGVFH